MHSFFFISIHPDFIQRYSDFGVFRSGVKHGLLSVDSINLRQFAADRHATVDGRPFGGGDGMVLRPDVLARAVQSLGSCHVVLASPSGRIWNQSSAESLLKINKPICFISGRFDGVDQRFIDHYVDEEYSIGDFVVSGGELPSLLMADSIARLIPGVLGHQDSAVCDSFASGMNGMLEHPLYTRPDSFEGVEVPEVLMSGHHARIKEWRQLQSYAKTKARRPDLLSPS